MTKKQEKTSKKDEDIRTGKDGKEYVQATMVFDDNISWIGSFNLDPRSAYYNTENVAIFESRDFANKLRNMILKDTQTSWHVTLDDQDNPVWKGRRPGDKRPQVHKHAPDTSIFRRIWKSICSLVPEKFV